MHLNIHFRCVCVCALNKRGRQGYGDLGRPKKMQRDDTTNIGESDETRVLSW